MDNSILPRGLAPRSSATAGRTEFTYPGVNPGIRVDNAPANASDQYLGWLG